MKLEVRCCCDASKVLGHIEHPQLQKLGDKLKVPIIAPMSHVWGRPTEPMRIIELEVDEVIKAPRLVPERESDTWVFKEETILAVKNHDYPIEDLMQVPGFEPIGQIDLTVHNE